MDWLRDLWASTADLRGRIASSVADIWDGTSDLRSDAGELASGFGGWIASFHLNLSRDSAIVVSVLFLALAVPSIFSAWVDRRFPKIGLVMVIVGGLMTFWTLNTYPGDYVWEDVPMAFIEVIASIVN